MTDIPKTHNLEWWCRAYPTSEGYHWESAPGGGFIIEDRRETGSANRLYLTKVGYNKYLIKR